MLKFRIALYPALAALAVACGTVPPPPQAPQPLPAPSQPVSGSAPGPTYGAATPGAYVWSQRMDDTERQLRGALQSSAATLRKTTDERLWITLPGDISFEANRAAIKPDAARILDKVALALRTSPVTQIRIVGHTDNRGAASANDALSLDRAMSTRDWLVGRGVPATRFAVAGRGSREPIESVDSEASRASNRRVEIVIGEKPPPR